MSYFDDEMHAALVATGWSDEGATFLASQQQPARAVAFLRRKFLGVPIPRKVYDKKRSTKRPIPNHIRWEVWERDDFRCRACGTRKYLSVDHIHPESKGGTLEIENLQTLCRLCNSRKGAR